MQFEIDSITCCSMCIAILRRSIMYTCIYIYIMFDEEEESYVRIEGKTLKMSSQEKNDIFLFEASFSRKSGLQTCC